MKKRTKHYGGFLVGDKVDIKGENKGRLGVGEVTALKDGYCDVRFGSAHICFLPKKLINLTREEEIKEEDETLFEPYEPSVLPPRLKPNPSPDITLVKKYIDEIKSKVTTIEVILNTKYNFGE